MLVPPEGKPVLDDVVEEDRLSSLSSPKSSSSLLLLFARAGYFRMTCDLYFWRRSCSVSRVAVKREPGGSSRPWSEST